MDGDVDANSQIDERELEEKDEKHVIEFDLNVGKKKATQQKGKGSRGPRITEEEKNLTLSLHRAHLTLLLLHFQNRFALTQNPELEARILSLLPTDIERTFIRDIEDDAISLAQLASVVNWFARAYTLDNATAGTAITAESLDRAAGEMRGSLECAVLLLGSLLIALGVPTRLVVQLAPLPIALTSGQWNTLVADAQAALATRRARRPVVILDDDDDSSTSAGEEAREQWQKKEDSGRAQHKSRAIAEEDSTCSEESDIGQRDGGDGEWREGSLPHESLVRLKTSSSTEARTAATALQRRKRARPSNGPMAKGTQSSARPERQSRRRVKPSSPFARLEGALGGGCMRLWLEAFVDVAPPATWRDLVKARRHADAETACALQSQCCSGTAPEVPVLEGNDPGQHGESARPAVSSSRPAPRAARWVGVDIAPTLLSSNSASLEVHMVEPANSMLLDCSRDTLWAGLAPEMDGDHPIPSWWWWLPPRLPPPKNGVLCRAPGGTLDTHDTYVIAVEKWRLADVSSRYTHEAPTPLVPLANRPHPAVAAAMRLGVGGAYMGPSEGKYTMRQSPHRLGWWLLERLLDDSLAPTPRWAWPPGVRRRADADRRDLDRIRHAALYGSEQPSAESPGGNPSSRAPLAACATDAGTVGDGGSCSLESDHMAMPAPMAEPGAAKAENEEMPTTLAALKHSTQYVAPDMLGRYQCFVSNAKSVGMVRGHLVYRRSDVVTLHTRSRWRQEGRVVPEGTVPLKRLPVKRPTPSHPSAELFALWQTVPAPAPQLVDGKIPINEYGNVELIGPSARIEGTIHITEPRIAITAKRLGIHYAKAMVGWEAHGGRSTPKIDGIVVLAADEAVLREAHTAFMQQAELNRLAKRRKVVAKRWLTLIRGLRARDKFVRRFQPEKAAAEAAASAAAASQAGPLTPAPSPALIAHVWPRETLALINATLASLATAAATSSDGNSAAAPAPLGPPSASGLLLVAPRAMTPGQRNAVLTALRGLAAAATPSAPGPPAGRPAAQPRKAAVLDDDDSSDTAAPPPPSQQKPHAKTCIRQSAPPSPPFATVATARRRANMRAATAAGQGEKDGGSGERGPPEQLQQQRSREAKAAAGALAGGTCAGAVNTEEEEEGEDRPSDADYCEGDSGGGAEDSEEGIEAEEAEEEDMEKDEANAEATTEVEELPQGSSHGGEPRAAGVPLLPPSPAPPPRRGGLCAAGHLFGPGEPVDGAVAGAARCRVCRVCGFAETYELL